MSKKDIDNRLPSIMTRIPSIVVKKITTTNYLPYDKATIQWSNTNFDNKLPSIMTRLPSNGVTEISTIDYLS